MRSLVLPYPWSSRVVSGPLASTWPRELLEMHNLRTQPRSTESDSLGLGPSDLGFNKPSR